MKSSTTVAGCNGKTPYPTYEGAEIVKRHLKQRRKKGPLSIYKCSHCNQYHIGNDKKNK